MAVFPSHEKTSWLIPTFTLFNQHILHYHVILDFPLPQNICFIQALQHKLLFTQSP